MIIDLICDFHRLGDSVVFILPASDFSNEVYGFLKSCYFYRNHQLRKNFRLLFENGYFHHVENLKTYSHFVFET